MKSIVVAVNFNSNAANAAGYAAGIALTFGADIHLVHVFEIPFSYAETPMPDSVFEELQQSGLDLLKGLASELESRTGGKVRITTQLETGAVEPVLEAICRSRRPLLVVMGASAGGLETALTGSNSVRAARRLPYPVLVVPEDARFQPIKNVTVACDGDDLRSGLPLAAPILQEIASLPGIRLQVMHVVRGEESAAEFTEAYNQWKWTVKGLSAELHFVRGAKIEEGLNDYLREYPADLLLVFPKNHGLFDFHRSHSRRLVLHCPLPVMSLHET